MSVRFIFLLSLTLVAEGSAQQVVPNLFGSDQVLSIALKGNVSPLVNDRKGTPKDHPMDLTYVNDDNLKISISVNVKTRGHFRRQSKICSYPPLSIQFSQEGPQANTIFSKQRKLKLVMPCTAEDYVVREYLVYKLYNLITPFSFRARLVKVTLVEEVDEKATPSFYGLLLEEEDQLAERVQYITRESKLVPQQIQQESFLTMAIFQYMIGNTDWSIQYLQNIKLLAKDASSLPIAVPYDFDHAGIVDAAYAKPAEELHLRSTRERRYRGYCLPDMTPFEPVVERYNRLKTSLYSVYLNDPNLDEKYKKTTTEFLDAFFSILSDPRQWQKEFSYPCDKHGTGNVVIKGLKK